MKLDIQAPEIIRDSNLSMNHQISLDQSNLYILMDILRSKLYSNPLQAMCREILSNAKDSHVEAGIPDKPIYIQLPNTFTNMLVVEDFGVGMSPEQIELVYSKMLNSTKRDSNDQIGGFGIGSKSPFAYTDSFNVISTYNGTRNSYAIYIDETKMGMISLLTSETTDNHNGVRIEIPIKKEDQDNLENHITKLIKYWKTTPDISEPDIVTDIKWFKDTALYETDDYRIPFSPEHRSIAILLDEIFFPIKNMNINNPIILKFKTGELSVATNRENLLYDEKTKTAIKNKVLFFIEDFYKHYDKQIKEAPSFIDAQDIFIKYRQIITRINNIVWTHDLLFFESEDKIRLDELTDKITEAGKKDGFDLSYSNSIYFKDLHILKADLNNSSAYLLNKNYLKHNVQLLIIDRTGVKLTSKRILRYISLDKIKSLIPDFNKEISVYNGSELGRLLKFIKSLGKEVKILYMTDLIKEHRKKNKKQYTTKKTNKKKSNKIKCLKMVSTERNTERSLYKYFRNKRINREDEVYYINLNKSMRRSIIYRLKDESSEYNIVGIENKEEILPHWKPISELITLLKKEAAITAFEKIEKSLKIKITEENKTWNQLVAVYKQLNKFANECKDIFNEIYLSSSEVERIENKDIQYIINTFHHLDSFRIVCMYDSTLLDIDKKKRIAIKIKELKDILSIRKYNSHLKKYNEKYKDHLNIINKIMYLNGNNEDIFINYINLVENQKRKKK